MIGWIKRLLNRPYEGTYVDEFGVLPSVHLPVEEPPVEEPPVPDPLNEGPPEDLHVCPTCDGEGQVVSRGWDGYPIWRDCPTCEASGSVLPS